AIDQAISAGVDLRVTLAIVLDQVLAQLRADAGCVLLLNPHGLSLDWAAERGFRVGSLQRMPLRLGEGLAGRAVIERQLVPVPRLADVPEEPRRAELFRQEGIT